MKTIEQAAYDCSELFEHSSAHRISFLNGVEFAQRWIPVEEELPEISDNLILVKNDNITVIRKIKTIYDVKDVSLFATHWRPIDLK